MSGQGSQGGSPHRWWHGLVLWGPPLAGLTWVLFVEPGPETTPPCPSMQILQVPCPACGTLRGVHALGHGDWQHAFALQPLLPVLLVALVLWVVFRARWGVWWSALSPVGRISLQASVAVAFVVWWLVRVWLYQRGLAGPV